MPYIDGFVLPVPKDKIEKYREIATSAGRVWREHGALEYRECLMDDPTCMDMRSFSDVAKASDEEAVLFSYIVNESREHRDQVNEKVMADPRIKELCNPENSPFDYRRMAYAGFSVLVDL